MPTDDTLIATTVRAAVPLVVAALVRRYGNLADSMVEQAVGHLRAAIEEHRRGRSCG